MDPIAFEFKLFETNPILLWLFRHGWEDPWWGTLHGQAALGLFMADMATAIREPELARAVGDVSGKLIAGRFQR